MVNWTEQDYADLLARRGTPGARKAPNVKLPPSTPNHLALGRLPVGALNKTETAYDAYLKEQLIAGFVLWYKFEAVKLRLADNTFYTPDFAVLPANGIFELHEVKGFWQDDARVKIKVAAALYPFRFIVVKARAKKNGGGWEREEFS